MKWMNQFSKTQGLRERIRIGPLIFFQVYLRNRVVAK